MYGNVQLLKVLIQLNADVTVKKSEDGRTPLHYAAQFNKQGDKILYH